ncbi:MAG: hypothetical protein OEU92_01280 [Alphaproteobacteria bacterium]|nr:hypothetical protein [Alphaproteobacteria bacterium]
MLADYCSKKNGKTMRWIALILLTTLGLSGCVGAPRTYGEFVQSTYSPTEFGFGAARRDLWTQFRGDPFGLGDEAFQAGMIDILAHHPPKPQPTNFTTDPGDSADTDYRVVFLFDPPTSLLQTRLCRLPLELPSGPGGAQPMQVAAAFCRYEGVLTAVRGQLDAATGLDDPAFDALIGQMVDALFPNFNPSQDDDDGFPFLLRRRR